jgi:multidrug efflux system membrane fusion protein
MANSDKALRPGMYVDVAVDLPAQHDALLVPVTAIQTSASGESIVVVRDITSDGGGTAEIIPVTTGRRVGDQVVVETGLKPGDVVVTQGQIRVQPGRPVTSVANASSAQTDPGAE